MPTEIQNETLDATGPFTKFVNGLLLAAALQYEPAALDWVVDRFNFRYDKGDLEAAHEKHHNRLLKHVYAKQMPFTSISAEMAVETSNTEIMSWIVLRDPDTRPMLIEATVKFGDAPLVEWWRVRHGVVFGQRELKRVIRAKNLMLVMKLLNGRDIEWDLGAALQAAEATHGQSPDEPVLMEHRMTA
ncbi:hypothetical protein HK105_207955 [Polyrhizophydium stewartii]|uniref:Uncharacterized protein n=1 Tax=Polyrhizophydium stewartii TaxID=2732419 RepID=A0ABR4MZE5_9FUNG